MSRPKKGWRKEVFRISVTFDGFDAGLAFHVDADSNAGFYSIEKLTFHYLLTQYLVGLIHFVPVTEAKQFLYRLHRYRFRFIIILYWLHH